METRYRQHHAPEYPLKTRHGAGITHLVPSGSPLEGEETPSSDHILRSSQSGIALVMAMLMSLAIMVLAVGVLYFVNQSSRMSGAGRRYVSASEAADGAIQLVKETINLTMRTDITALNALTGQAYSSADTTCIADAIWDEKLPCQQATLTLLGALGKQNYTASISLSRLYTATVPGISVQFPPSGISSAATFYKITAIVLGPGGAASEVSVLYRFI